jgi:hypothetical protein
VHKLVHIVRVVSAYSKSTSSTLSYYKIMSGKSGRLWTPETIVYLCYHHMIRVQTNCRSLKRLSGGVENRKTLAYSSRRLQDSIHLNSYFHTTGSREAVVDTVLSGTVYQQDERRYASISTMV